MTKSIGQDFKFFTLLKFALPSMAMMVFMSLYTIIDGVFISRLVGSDALSAANIIYPAVNILIAAGVMLATGGSAIIAKKIGERKEKEAKENFTLIVAVGVLFGVAALAVGNVFIHPLVTAMGATERIMEDCITYLSILLFFAPACMLQLLFQSFFVTAGRPGIGLAVTVAGGITNAVLDYILMGPLQMGIAGAALATGFGQLIPAVSGLIYFASRNHDLHFIRPRLDWKVLADSCLNGSSEMVTNLSTAVVTFLFNTIMLRLLGEEGVAAITIVLYGQFLFNALYLGFSIGVAPVFSFNYGSRNEKLLKRIYKICIRFIGISSVLICIFALAGSSIIVEIFTPKSSAIYEIARRGFFLFSFNYVFAGINIFASAMFTAFSNGKVSAVISFLRTFVFIVASVLLLPYLIGVDGVWFAVPLAEGMTIFVSVYFFRAKKEVYHYGTPRVLTEN
ncbi:MATE family efflux transporter [Lactonifactor longoviformis]|uniref:Multidrug export protein MepA n=1 Tax=Lactonifactor longoviformis DSM 17459 TaxID=1122155 RepID=A0A1M4YC52_9CLOT|nr:MATE family efflux transporter [Lactonifactor longoviformis]POP31302.1 MATE family efflux transporter [Lactonifactor longoviformis]SHF03411.1 putative efflux protein, MATE family [Lactonifactor longoviformis DSM 17459]